MNPISNCTDAETHQSWVSALVVAAAHSRSLGSTMIDYATFMRIKQKYDHYGSWAVWANTSDKPKERVGDLGVSETTAGGDLLKQLNPYTVPVGLNISRRIQFPSGHFHDGRPRSMDYKIRYALKWTVLCGAYTTDMIKDFEQR